MKRAKQNKLVRMVLVAVTATVMVAKTVMGMTAYMIVDPSPSAESRHGTQFRTVTGDVGEAMAPGDELIVVTADRAIARERISLRITGDRSRRLVDHLWKENVAPEMFREGNVAGAVERMAPRLTEQRGRGEEVRLVLLLSRPLKKEQARAVWGNAVQLHEAGVAIHVIGTDDTDALLISAANSGVMNFVLIEHALRMKWFKSRQDQGGGVIAAGKPGPPSTEGHKIDGGAAGDDQPAARGQMSNASRTAAATSPQERRQDAAAVVLDQATPAPGAVDDGAEGEAKTRGSGQVDMATDVGPEGVRGGAAIPSEYDAATAAVQPRESEGALEAEIAAAKQGGGDISQTAETAADHVMDNGAIHGVIRSPEVASPPPAAPDASASAAAETKPSGGSLAAGARVAITVTTCVVAIFVVTMIAVIALYGRRQIQHWRRRLEEQAARTTNKPAPVRSLRVKVNDAMRDLGPIPRLGKLRIGSDSGSSIRISHRKVEPRHALLFSRGNDVFLKNLTRGEIRVNDKPLRRRCAERLEPPSNVVLAEGVRLDFTLG